MGKMRSENATTDSLVEFSKRTERLSQGQKKEFIDYINKKLPELHIEFLRDGGEIGEVDETSPYYRGDMD